jgi:hypothetical protein
MTEAAEYQRYASECIRLATEANSEESRQAFLRLALAWVQVAMRVEGAAAPNESAEPQARSAGRP